MSHTTQTILLFLAAIPSIILHEISHGYVALKCGDTTARDAGRLTLNPVSHIDPVGTVVLPLFLAVAGLPMIGYAKPVPVNVSRLRHPRNQSVYVSVAGPLTNIAISALAWLVTKMMLNYHVNVTVTPNYIVPGNVFLFFVSLGLVNISLAILNLLPIPPLDGSVLIERLVPRRHLAEYYRLRSAMLPFAMLILLALVYFGVFGSITSSFENFWITHLLN